MAQTRSVSGITEAVSTGIKQMDTEDVIGFVAGLIGSAVFFQLAQVTIAGTDVNAQVGSYSIFGQAITWAMVLAIGGGLYQLATNQLRGDSPGFNVGPLETWGLVLSMVPTFLVFWSTEFQNYVYGDYMISGALTIVAAGGYVLLAAAPQMKYRG